MLYSDLFERYGRGVILMGNSDIIRRRLLALPVPMIELRPPWLSKIRFLLRIQEWFATRRMKNKLLKAPIPFFIFLGDLEKWQGNSRVERFLLDWLGWKHVSGIRYANVYTSVSPGGLPRIDMAFRRAGRLDEVV